MSIDFTVPLQREAKAKHDSDGDVAVAGIWLALYLVMVVRTLLVNLNGPVMGLVLFVAAIGGCGVLGWRRNKRTMALVRYGTTVMKSAIFRVAVLIGLLGGVFGSANANTVDVSYTISGSPGNWTYNFLVTNNINVAQNVYAFGVLTPGTVGASPTNWSDQSSQASSFDSDLHSLGASSTAYNNYWATDPTASNTISPTHSLSGFEVTDTSSAALTTISFIAIEVSSTLDHGLKFLGGDCFNCVVNCHANDCGWNPGFEGEAIGSFLASETPLPGTLSLFAGGLGVIGFLMKRKKANAATAVT